MRTRCESKKKDVLYQKYRRIYAGIFYRFYRIC